MKTVVFTAACPLCGGDCRWTQHAENDALVQTGDFDVTCECSP